MHILFVVAAKMRVEQNANNGPLQKNSGSAAQTICENLQRVRSTKRHNSGQMP